MKGQWNCIGKPVFVFALALALSGCVGEPTWPRPVAKDDPGHAPVDSSKAARLEVSFARELSAPLQEFDTITVRAAILDLAGRTVQSASLDWNLTSLSNTNLDAEEVDPIAIVATGPRTALLTVGNRVAKVEATSVFGQTRLVGVLDLPGDTRRPEMSFIWSREAGLVVLPRLAGMERMLARDLNDDLEVVGSVFLQNSSQSFAFLWSAGSGYTYPAGGTWGSHSEANSINEAGAVTGSRVSRPFIWKRDSGMEILPVSAGFSTGKAINASGQVAFESDLKSFRWSPVGGIVELSVHPWLPHSSIVAMNDSGYVLGYDGNWDDWGYVLSERLPILWTPSGERIEIADCRGCGMTVSGLNNRTAVVGSAHGRAFAWHRSTGLTWLNISPTYDVAVAVNDGGDIAGYTRSAVAGTDRAWLRERGGNVFPLPLPEGARTMRVTSINSNGVVAGIYR